MSSNPPPPSSARRVRGAHESRSATVRAAAAAPSRRQRSHWQREQQQQHMLFLAIGVLVLVIVAIFAGGLIYDNLIRANAVVAQVGSDSITASQLLDEVRPQARALDAQATQYGGTDNQQIADYVNQQKRSLPSQVLNDMVDNTLIQQEATRRGISVSPAELDDKVRQTVAQYEASVNATPTAEPTAPADENATPEGTSAALTSATPELTALPVQAALASPTDVASPTALTTPTPVPTLDDSAYGPALQDLLTKNNLTEADFRTQLERSLLQQKVQDAIGQEQVPDSQPQVHARQIVVASSAQDLANSLEDQLKNQGADFAQLAQQNSTDTATKDKGGDMGWFPKGVQTSAIDTAVFSMQQGQISDPILDASGYHIIQVLETDPNRPVAADQLSSLRSKAYSDWLNTQHNSPDVKLSLDQNETNWVLARIGVRP